MADRSCWKPWLVAGISWALLIGALVWAFVDHRGWKAERANLYDLLDEARTAETEAKERADEAWETAEIYRVEKVSLIKQMEAQAEQAAKDAKMTSLSECRRHAHNLKGTIKLCRGALDNCNKETDALRATVDARKDQIAAKDNQSDIKDDIIKNSAKALRRQRVKTAFGYIGVGAGGFGLGYFTRAVTE